MATGVNIKMGVTGVAQFKQSINTAKQSIKTMDQALALNEKQFKATGDAEDYMKQKSELLQAKLAEQRDVIAQAERALKQMSDQGVDKASKAFQDMQRQLLQAKGDLLDTESALSGIDEAGEDAANSVGGMNTQLKNIGKQVSLESVKSGIDKITGAMQKAAGWAWKLGEALVKNVLGAGSYADELATESAKWGVDVETLQRMRKTATIIDTDADTILAARDKLVKGVNKGGEDVMGAFAEIGIDPKQFTATKEGIEDLFWTAGEWISRLEDEGDKELYATAIFGKSWRDLEPVFKEGRQQYEEMMGSWSVLSEEQINNLGKMDDSYQRMSQEWETFKLQILETLSGPMAEVMDTISRLLQELNAYLSSEDGQKMMEELGSAISEFFSGLKDVEFKSVVEAVKGALDGIKSAFDWIVENKDAIVTAIGALAFAFGGLKLAGIAVGLGQLVSGFKGMFGGGAGAAAGGGTPVATTGAAAGGAMVGLRNTITGGSAKLANLIGGTGMFFPVVGDMFMNQTNAGRSLRDGGNFWEGIMQDVHERADTIASNIESFGKDWGENVVMKWAGGLFGVGGMPVDTNPIVQAAEEMYRGPKGAGGGGGGHHFGNEPTHEDFQEFAGLPASILAAVKEGVANITVVIDGPEMTQQVGGGIAGRLNLMAVR